MRGLRWREYGFKGKPGDVRRIPRQFAPYHLRLDWLMWFLPLGRLLGAVVRACSCFGCSRRTRPRSRCCAPTRSTGSRRRGCGRSPYHYRFTTHAEFRETGQRWIRTFQREVIGPAGLRAD